MFYEKSYFFCIYKKINFIKSLQHMRTYYIIITYISKQELLFVLFLKHSLRFKKIQHDI